MTAVQDDFNFYTVGTSTVPFAGYDSSSDPTKLPPTYLVRGSKNVLKDDNNNLVTRPGLKRYLAEDSSLNAITSSYEWQTSFAEDRIIRVLEDGQFQVLFEEEWITLETFDTNRFVFTTWWADQIQQELLVFVNGTTNLYAWSGGITDSVGDVNTAGVMATGQSGPTNTLNISVTVGSERIYVANNGLTAASVKSAVIFETNPEINDEIQYIIGSNSPFKSGTVQIRFVNTLPGSPDTMVGYVRIGATKEDTAANLLGFLTAPSVGSSTHKEITDADTITAIGYETYAAVSSLETADGETWASKGFTSGYPESGSSLTVGGISYTYSLVSDKYLINISGTPALDTTAYQDIYTSPETPSDTFVGDFVVTINNQVGVGSYSSPIFYFSADSDFTDFTNSGDIISGDPDQIVLDELPRGAIVVSDAVYIAAGSGNWYICKPNTPVPISQPLTTGNDRLVIVDVEKKVGASRTAALAHEFIGSIADTIVYLGQDNQLRMFGVFKDILGTKYPSISINLKQELTETDFTGGQLRAIGDNIYLVAPIPGKTYIYQQRDDVDETGSIVSARVWQPPQDWNISRIALINDIQYGYSNQSPETYQLFNTDQYYDDTPSGVMPYECVAAFGYWQFKDRTKKGDIGKIYLEGYMQQNNDLICTLRSDYLGSTAIEDVVVSALDNSPVLYTETGVLVGDKLIGQQLLGGASGLTGMPKFRAIPKFKKHQCFEYQVVLSSFAPDARWELLCMGTNGSEVINKPVNLIKG